MREMLLIVMLGAPLAVVAEEMHHHHDAGAMDEGITIAAGAMAPTGEGLSTAQRCELARRGVVILDNAAWGGCGGKPEGMPLSVVPQMATPSAPHHPHGGH